MDKSLYYNGSKQLDPTMGCVLNKIAREEHDREAWLKIARTLSKYLGEKAPLPATGLLKA